MNLLVQAFLALRRDWRSGELRLIGIAVVIAVASLTSVGFFTDRVRQATELQATELLAADLVIGGRDPIGADLVDDARARDLTATLSTSFNSVVVAGEKMQMAEVKAVQDGYPIRGRLRVSDVLFGAEREADDLPVPGTVWVDARLLQALDIDIGSRVGLGALQFTVTRVLTYEPDRGGDLFNLAPRLLMNQADVPGTSLILPGSRVEYYLLVGGQADAVNAYRQQVDRIGAERRLRIRGIRDARPELRRALERAEQFLGLAALVSIALAGLAVAMSAQRYAVRHFDNCAILRCLGAEQRTITGLYLIQLLALSLASSLAGCAIGYVAQAFLTAMMADMSQSAIPSASLRPIGTGLACGMVTVLGFAMPQILRLRSVSPLRVLRRDLEPVPAGGWTTYTLAVLALALLSPWQSGNLRLTLYTFGGMLLTGGLLMLCARFLIGRLNRLRSRVGVAVRYGLANVARRKQQSVAQILGIGLGVMVMLLLTLIRTDLLDTWRSTIPEGTPNYFLINIQTDEVDRLRRFLAERATVTSRIYPMIRARLKAINGVAVETESGDSPESRRWARREYNLTWARDLQADNRILAGKWWSGATPGHAEFSLEDGMAREMGLQLHDTLTYTIGGMDVSGEITSIRLVDWDTFNANFFIIASPGSLDGYPGTLITSFYLPSARRGVMLDLVREFPSVTVIDIDALITQVRGIMNRVIRAVEFVFGFTLLAGIVVLLAALQTTHDERAYESALMSSLGASRRQILAGLTAEFFCLGLVAGTLSAAAATLVEMTLARLVFRMDMVINPWVWLIAPAVCVAVVVGGGLLGTRKVLYTPPMVALRRI